MLRMTLYHLTFPHGLHIGVGSVESVCESRETAPSDTVFAALLDTWRQLGRDVDALLPENGAPVFKVTSAFPFAGEVRFYPKPVDLRELFTEKTLKDESAGKHLKKIRYLSEGLLCKAAQGAYLDDFLFSEADYEDPEHGIALQGGVFWCLTDEVDKLPASWRLSKDKWWTLRRKTVFASQTAPRVTVDRVNSASKLFQSERVVFTAGCGLWLGVALDSLSQADFDNLLATLADAGLGGERTAGYGHFVPEKQTVPLELPQPQTCAYLLSRWHPQEAEISWLKQSAYKLEAVEGWLRTSHGADQLRRKVWLVAEGSLIMGQPQGQAVDVRPQPLYGATFPHPVYRPGFAVAIDWKPKVAHE